MVTAVIGVEDEMPELLTLNRMARRAGVTQRWLRDQAEAGTIPSLKAGARYLFEAEATLTALAKMAALADAKGVSND